MRRGRGGARRLAPTCSPSNREARFGARTIRTRLFLQRANGAHRGARTGDYGYGDVAALVRRAAGEDPFGYRAEFIGFVCLAKRLDKSVRSPG